jgi:hypothetical protein
VGGLPSAPTSELGQAGQLITGINTDVGYIDEREWVDAFRFPTSIETADRMATDPQVAGLECASYLPMRRFRYSIDPGDARDEVAQGCADDIGIPILGEKLKRPLRTRDRFSLDDHLRLALRAPRYGFYPFEQVGRIDEREMWRLRKLAPRPPFTIMEVRVARDGGLVDIKQNLSFRGIQGPPPIPVNRLVFYCWDREGGNWYGRSALRPLYGAWRAKRDLVGIDVVKHRRNGMGVPVSRETQEGIGKQQAEKAAAVANSWRTGDHSSAHMPYGTDLDLKGVTGNLPDTLASIRYHDQQMARAWGQMFAELGSTEHGSRALGAELGDLFRLTQDAIAKWFVETFTAHVIEDWVDWNYGEDEPAPTLVFERDESPELALGDLGVMVERGLIDIDDELKAYLRERYNLPTAEEIEKKAPQGQSYAYDLDYGVITVDERRAQIGLPPLPNGAGEVPATPSIDRREEGGPAGDLVATAARTARGKGGMRYVVTRAALADPSPRRRDPTDREVRAAADFDVIDAQWRDSLAQLLEAWEDVTAAQVDALVSQVEDADGDLEQLAVLDAPVEGESIIADAMRAVAREAAEIARAEAKAQGVDLAATPVMAAQADMDPVEESIAARAAAYARRLAASLTESAAWKAVADHGTDDLAATVRSHLESLSGAFVEQRLGGALSAAQTEGRAATQAAAEKAAGGAEYDASELLDTNTCDACASHDGTTYTSLDDARRDYPGAGFVGCEGGDRCRGLLVQLLPEG